jgi:pyruvate kinase
MRRIVTTTTIPDRKFRKAIGVGREDLLMLSDGGESLEVRRSDNGKVSVIGRKALSRRLGVKLAGAELRWHWTNESDSNAAFEYVLVSDDRTGYDS